MSMICAYRDKTTFEFKIFFSDWEASSQPLESESRIPKLEEDASQEGRIQSINLIVDLNKRWCRSTTDLLDGIDSWGAVLYELFQSKGFAMTFYKAFLS